MNSIDHCVRFILESFPKPQSVNYLKNTCEQFWFSISITGMWISDFILFLVVFMILGFSFFLFSFLCAIRMHLNHFQKLQLVSQLLQKHLWFTVSMVQMAVDLVGWWRQKRENLALQQQQQRQPCFMVPSPVEDNKGLKLSLAEEKAARAKHCTDGRLLCPF